MPEQKSSIERCDACGTTRIIYDPPIELIESEPCNAVKPGTYSSTEEIPTCDLAKGHDGKHGFFLEKIIEWNDKDYTNS